MAREEEDQNFVKFGLDVLTLAVLAILITAPIGALGIGLAGPRLLDRQVKGQNTFSFNVTFILLSREHRKGCFCGVRELGVSCPSVCLSWTSDLPKIYFYCTVGVSRRKLAAARVLSSQGLRF